jgi:CheY-like chemotaxis protein
MASEKPAAATTVLVVDDDQDIREILSEILRDAGYIVVVASDGREALERLRSATPSLILLDLNMPGIDGFELIGRLRQDPASARVPVVVMSAVSEMTQRVAGLDVDDALAKPINLAQLLQVVERYRK